jgi:uncharacterized membrane protein YeaQ/YmgE (transglycosylase-associated protein family)
MLSQNFPRLSWSKVSNYSRLPLLDVTITLDAVKEISYHYAKGNLSLMLHIIWSIIVGFIVGLIAHAFVPGAGPMGFWLTSITGIVGSVVGGLIARIFSKPKDGAMFHPAGFFLSIIGAIIVLVIVVHLHAPAQP